MNIVLISTLIIAVIIIIILLIRSNSYKNKLSQNEMMFNDLKSNIEITNQLKRETAKRRYITKKMKTDVYERDEYCCQICGISKGYLDSFVNGLGDYLLLEIDHINSVANGGEGDDIENLQVLCWRCNRKKGKNKTNEDVNKIRDYGIDYLGIKEQI